MQRLVCLVLVGLLGSALAQPSRDQTAVVATVLDATSMDPWLSTNITDKNVVSHLYDTLLWRDEDMTIQPNVARAYRAVDDTTWEFELRDDITFSNGELLTAEDVRYTVEHFRDPELGAPSTSQFDPIEAVEVVDEHTVRFVTSEPFPALPAVMTEFWVIPDGYTAEAGSEGLSRTPVGSGPYLLEGWLRDERIVLRANPNWWGGSPEIPYVEFRVVPNQNTRIAQAQTGEADVVSQMPEEAAPLLERNPDLKLLQAPNPRAYFISFNTQLDTPLTDVRVRQAVNYAINVEEIVEIIFGGNGQPLATLLTPQQFGYNPDVEGFTYDREKAQELLAEAGYPDGFSIAMEAPAERYPKGEEVAQIIASQLGAVGIGVDLMVQEWGTYINQFGSEVGPPMFLLGWSIPTFDPDSTLTPLLTEDAVYGRFVDPELTSLITEARETVDEAERAALYADVQRLLIDLTPMAYLYQLNELYAVSTRLDWQPRADERVYLWNASLVQ